jgi:hypothetical protein
MMLRSALCALTLGMGLSTANSPAQAQSGYADKAVAQVFGRWQDANGRTINFKVDELYNTVFEDEVQNNIVVRGALRRDAEGANIRLIYPRGSGRQPQVCRYNVNLTPSVPDNKLMFVLVEATPAMQESAPFRCIQGLLTRLPDRD